jgi:hypothetical protein
MSSTDVTSVTWTRVAVVSRWPATGRPGETTSREPFLSVGSRCASTRIAEENRSMDRLRAASSWRWSALGIKKTAQARASTTKMIPDKSTV